MKKVNDFIQLLNQYPLLYVEVKNDKERKALENVLEELWMFNSWDDKHPNTMANARNAFRDYEVLVAMMQDFEVKKEYCEKVVDSLEECCKIAFNEVGRVMKKHQKLNSHFKDTFKMRPSDFKREISKWKFDNL